MIDDCENVIEEAAIGRQSPPGRRNKWFLPEKFSNEIHLSSEELPAASPSDEVAVIVLSSRVNVSVLDGSGTTPVQMPGPEEPLAVILAFTIVGDPTVASVKRNRPPMRIPLLQRNHSKSQSSDTTPQCPDHHSLSFRLIRMTNRGE